MAVDIQASEYQADATAQHESDSSPARINYVDLPQPWDATARAPRPKPPKAAAWADSNKSSMLDRKKLPSLSFQEPNA